MASPDLSEFEALAQPRKRPCQIGVASEALTPEDAAKLAAACEADRAVINNSAIRKWLKIRDLDASINGITSHRSGTCSCARS